VVGDMPVGVVSLTVYWPGTRVGRPRGRVQLELSASADGTESAVASAYDRMLPLILLAGAATVAAVGVLMDKVTGPLGPFGSCRWCGHRVFPVVVYVVSVR
jgi:hypothetical protein